MMLLKTFLNAAKFFGLYWFFVALAPGLIFELITRRGSMNIVPLAMIMESLLIVACVLAPLTTIQSIVRMVRKDQNFNIYRAIIALFNSQGKKIGIELKIDGESVALKSANNLSGVTFGKKGMKYITKPESTDGHILVIGGAGSGKTSAIAIPTLVSWQERVFAIDIKGELYEKTKAFRDANKIKVFNPTDRTAFRYDPYYMLHVTDDISGEARSLALSICPLSAETKDPFWINNAQDMLTGFVLYYFGIGFNFSETMVHIKSKPVKDTVDEIMTSDNKKAILEISQFAGMDDKTLSGVFAELSSHITVFASSDDLQRALDGSGACIIPADLEEGYDIYCCIPEYKLEQWKDLLGMMCNQFLKFFERRPDANKTPILFLVDEFPRLGKIEIICNGLATLRSKKSTLRYLYKAKAN